MRCIVCGGKLKTIDSRQYEKDNTTERKKRCVDCENVFKTIERMMSLQASNSTGRTCRSCIYKEECTTDEKYDASKERYWCWSEKDDYGYFKSKEQGKMLRPRKENSMRG